MLLLFHPVWEVSVHAGSTVSKTYYQDRFVQINFCLATGPVQGWL